jgi:DNA-directed RNA polymerase subunit F
LKKDSEIKMLEAISLTKIESQQAIAQARVDAEREINKVRTEMAEKVAKIQGEESEKFYNKLTEAFQEMQLNGDKNSKFVQEMALRILDKTPTANVDLSIKNQQLPAPKDV